MKARGTATDKLTDIIQALQLVRKTGYLTVQYDDVSGFSEVGIIVFREGQVVDASVGQLRGLDAFKKLIMWTHCYFIFEPVSSASPPQILLPPSKSKESGLRSGERYSQEQSQSEQSQSEEYLSIKAVPVRTPLVQSVVPDFQRLGLSRIHRQLFLLVDGKRSAWELARLIGRTPPEVLAILADLVSAGLIRDDSP